jgi:DNA-binding MarR family transcriptional regulator
MMGMEPTSLSRTLRNMDERGLIQREQDDQDKRIIRVKLTREGKRLRDVSRKTVVKFNQRLLSEVSPQKLEHFKEIIQIIDQHTMKEA